MKVYIANRPAYANFSDLDVVRQLKANDIYSIGQACGNGWRKVFNVYAKLVFALNDNRLMTAGHVDKWQDYREQTLLQKGSNTALLFSPPNISPVDETNTRCAIHIIMGRTYANSLHLPNTLQWLDREFAIDSHFNLLVCPYFDYRQLSNVKIIRLVELIRGMWASR